MVIDERSMRADDPKGIMAVVKGATGQAAWQQVRRSRRYAGPAGCQTRDARGRAAEPLRSPERFRLEKDKCFPKIFVKM